MDDSPQVSIIVLAYNHLDYTKMCVENLFKYTSDIDYELITINNGSSDGTEEFFNSLPNSKKINFKDNIGVDAAINHGIKIAQGKYTLNLSNDIIVTHNWMKNLITCIQSDEKVGMVVPVCGYSSNFQQVNFPYETLEEMHELTKVYNKSNPRLWEERIRLVTYTCLFRTDLLQAIGGFDEDFNPGGFDDDAISFTIRRLGYKLILAKDTYVHHFGSVTFDVEYTKNNLVERNRKLFIQKFGVDSWQVYMIDFNILGLIDYSKINSASILGIGESFGTTLLQVKNEYKKRGVFDVKLFYLAKHAHQIPDLKTICEFCLCGDPLDADYYFKDRLFDYIIIESETGSIQNFNVYFNGLNKLLKQGGSIIITASNKLILSKIENSLNMVDMKRINQIKNYYYCFKKI